METMLIDGLTLFFDADERDAAELIGQACCRTVQIMHETWDLETPEDCRVYVMTSWLRFIFHSAPWHWKILLGQSIPSWYFRVKKLWKYAGGWAQQYGKRRTIGVKPPRLIEVANRSMGERIFITEDDMSKKVQHITCHELTHAFTAHLKLPMWLNEGLAMVAVDRFFGKPTVKHDTIESLARSSQRTSPGRYRKLTVDDPDAIVYQYVRGYWLTRYIEDTQPELLRNLLSQRSSHRELESKVAAAYGMRREKFWSNIDEVLVSHFGQEG